MNELTIDQGHKMRLLMFSTIDVCNNAHELVYLNIVHSSLNMKTQVFAFEAEEFTIINYDSDLTGEPSWLCPILFTLGSTYSSIDYQHVRHTPY